MSARDLKLSFIAAAFWLVCVTCYAVLGNAVPGVDDVGSGSGIVPIADEFIPLGIADKHGKLPQHWTHQHWGAV